MLVSEWAKKYWEVSTVTKKTLYDYKSVFGRIISPQIGHLEIENVSLLDVQKRVLSTTPYQARLSLMIVKTLYREAKIYGMTDKNPTIGVKLPKRPEPKRVFLTWDQVNALDWGKYNDQVRFLALHGLRWSEAVALTEHDISDEYVSVNKSI
jgi:integrase